MNQLHGTALPANLYPDSSELKGVSSGKPLDITHIRHSSGVALRVRALPTCLLRADILLFLPVLLLLLFFLKVTLNQDVIAL